MSVAFDPIGKTALYRLYDAEGVLLYVGVSDELKTRFKAHPASKPWWPSVHSRRIEWFDNRLDAEVAEQAAIHDEGPLWNRDSPWVAVVVADGRLAVAEKVAVQGRAKADETLTSAPICRSTEADVTDDDEDRVYSAMLAAVVEEIRSGALQPGQRLASASGMGERFGVHRTKISRMMEKLRWIGLVTGPAGGLTKVAQEPARTLALEVYTQAARLRHMGRCPACDAGRPTLWDAA